MRFRWSIVLACTGSVLALVGCDSVPSESPVEGAAAAVQPAPATLVSLALDSVVAVASREVVASGGEPIQRVNVRLADYRERFDRFRGTYAGFQGEGGEWLAPAEISAAVEQSIVGTRLTEVTVACEGKRRCTLQPAVLLVLPGPVEEFPNGAFLLHFHVTWALANGYEYAPSEPHPLAASDPYPVWMAPDEDGIYHVAGVGMKAVVERIDATVGYHR